MAVVSRGDLGDSHQLEHRRRRKSLPLLCGAASSFSRGLAKLVPRDVDYGETSTFFWYRPKICFDEDLDRFLARINLDAYGRIPKINFVSATIFPRMMA